MVSCSINDDDLCTKISEELKNNREINLSELNDFEWDSMMILSPYMSIDRVADEHKLDLSKVEKYITISDVTHVLVFLKARKAVKYCIVSRIIGDFQEIDKEIAKRHAHFKVIADSLGLARIKLSYGINF